MLSLIHIWSIRFKANLAVHRLSPFFSFRIVSVSYTHLLAMCVGLGSLTACMPSQGQRKEEPAGLTETMTELSGGHMLEDNDGMPVTDTDYLPLPSFGTLEPGSVFNVNWRTTEGEYMAGTAFVAQIEESDQPLLRCV